MNGNIDTIKGSERGEWGILIQLKEREWLMGDIDMLKWSESG